MNTENQEKLAGAIRSHSRRLTALMKHLDAHDCNEFSCVNDNIFRYGNQEYLVLTDYEAYKAAREHIRDGRGHFLSGYDGEEHEVNECFIYRIN